jgi:hypothetical protein
MSGIIGGAGSKSGVIGTTELDYEEGVWTATCNNGVTLYSSADLGSYTKTGRMVTCGGQFRILSSNSSSALQFNLPFTSRVAAGESSELYTSSTIRVYGMNLNADAVWVMGYIASSTKVMEIQNNRDNLPATACPATDGGSNYVMFSITYPTAE